MHENFLKLLRAHIILDESQIRTKDQSRCIDTIRFNEPC